MKNINIQRVVNGEFHQLLLSNEKGEVVSEGVTSPLTEKPVLVHDGLHFTSELDSVDESTIYLTVQSLKEYVNRDK